MRRNLAREASGWLLAALLALGGAGACGGPGGASPTDGAGGMTAPAGTGGETGRDARAGAGGGGTGDASDGHDAIVDDADADGTGDVGSPRDAHPGTGGAGDGAPADGTAGDATSVGDASGPRDGGGGADAVDPGGPIGIVGVGYGGIRIVSRDLGRTWTDETHWAANGGDDNNLLRAIAYGNGIWAAGGWRYVTSPDGVAWTDRGMAVDAIKAVRCDVTDSMAFGAGRFVVACGSNLAWSTDAIAWTKIGSTPSVGGHTTLVFDPGTGRFGISGDNDRSYVSSDGGQTWTSLDGVSHVRFCHDALRSESDCPSFWAADTGASTDGGAGTGVGVFLGTVWAGVIRRSTDGSRWSNVYNDPAGNTLFTDYAFAVGAVAPR